MKSIKLTIVALFLGSAASAQSFTIHQGTKATGYNAAAVDSVTFSSQDVQEEEKSDARVVDATWCALGTSITWYNDHPNGFKEGYETRLLKKLKFTKWYNQGISGGTLSSAINQVKKADYYTIEHGINDWGHSTPVGTIDDYINNTKNGTFAAIYRQLIEKIFEVNPNAKVVLCTPARVMVSADICPTTAMLRSTEFTSRTTPTLFARLQNTKASPWQTSLLNVADSTILTNFQLMWLFTPTMLVIS